MQYCSTSRPDLYKILFILLACFYAQFGYSKEEPNRSFFCKRTKDGIWLYSSDGKALVNLIPELKVTFSSIVDDREHGAHLVKTGVFEDLQIQTKSNGDWKVIGKTKIGPVHYSLTLTNIFGDPKINIHFESFYEKELFVLEEVLRFKTGSMREHPKMMDRAYRMASIVSPSFTGPLSPHVVNLSHQLTLIGGIGFQGMWVLPSGKKKYTVELEQDHYGNHPVVLNSLCLNKNETHKFFRRLSWTHRTAGSRKTAQAFWVANKFLPFFVGRYPYGYQAALVFSDHADQSSKKKLEAFAFGKTGALQRGEIGPLHPGFVNRGLTYTKTIFIKKVGNYAAQFDNSEYRYLLDQMVKRKVEIGVHTPSGHRDKPEDVKQLLGMFRKSYAGRTWIDHQPSKNCEDITNRGWDSAGNWYVLPHLANFGFKFLWAGQDLPLPKNSLNMFSPEYPSIRRPILYQNNRISVDGFDFDLFSSVFFFMDRKRFARKFSDENIDRLIKERGFLIAHVYFESNTKAQRYKGRSLIEKDKFAGYFLRPEVDDIFKRLSERHKKGDLWISTIGSVAESVMNAMQTELKYLKDGKVQVISHSKNAISGLTLLFPTKDVRILIDGKKPNGSKNHQAMQEIWFDLKPGETRTIHVYDSNGNLVSLITPTKITMLAESQGSLEFMR